MIASVKSRFVGASLNARFLRGSVFTLGGYAASQALRLASNLILTRLLFPEAFGLMALVAVIMQGLAMFSDVGVSPAIMQSKRGDDQRFLDTAWTIQVLRGALLWLVACVIAIPVAQIYDEPLLAWVLPCSGISLLIAGFNPTRVDTANRHLLLGRLTGLDLIAQVLGLIIAVVLAWFLQTVWALVISGVATAIILLVLYSVFLPGAANRFLWEKSAAAELISFGKWDFPEHDLRLSLYARRQVSVGKVSTSRPVWHLQYWLFPCQFSHPYGWNADAEDVDSDLSRKAAFRES